MLGEAAGVWIGELIYVSALFKRVLSFIAIHFIFQRSFIHFLSLTVPLHAMCCSDIQGKRQSVAKELHYLYEQSFSLLQNCIARCIMLCLMEAANAAHQ